MNLTYLAYDYRSRCMGRMELSVERAVEMTCEPGSDGGAVESCDRHAQNIAEFVGKLTGILAEKEILNAEDLKYLLNVRGLEITEEEPTDL